ncbi:putative manganese transporter [Anaeromicrobium sediminis]|nr:putative manganese transporter [Anaeromicrobium sediminis]
MGSEVLSIILNSAENAFLQVGVFVGAVLLLFGYINYKQSGNFIRKIEESKKIQPILGALLGLTPGCGGAIFVMPLFVKGKVTFGTIIATLIATMGDSAFVIISTLPLEYILVSVISFIAAIITGYVVDYYHVGDKLLKNMNIITREEAHIINEKSDHNIINNESVEEFVHIGHDEGDEIDVILHHNAKGHQEHGTVAYEITHKGFIIYWGVLVIGLILGIMLLFQMDVNDLIIKDLGKIVGIGGTILSIILMIMSKKFIGDDTHEEAELKSISLKETIIHSASETAFVSTWVYLAYLIYEFGIFFLGKGNYGAGELIMTNLMTSAGLYAVLVGALIGLIPGCGPQVIFVALFTKGLVPFGALVANAISQDGDALFPLLVIDRKSSLWATIITTIPALIIGLIIYFIEMRMV